MAVRTKGVCVWRKFYWDTATLIHSAVQGRLYATPAQLSSSDSDPLSCEAEDTDCLDPHRKLATLVRKQEEGPMVGRPPRC